MVGVLHLIGSQRSIEVPLDRVAPFGLTDIPMNSIDASTGNVICIIYLSRSGSLN